MVNGYLIRCETMDGSTSWRVVPDLEHGTLCRAFRFDPCSTRFDLPRSARGVGSSSVGATPGPSGARGRHINGYVFQGPPGSDPIGVLQFVREDEKIPDIDPHSRDLLNLERR
jgi:hypothetical protein